MTTTLEVELAAPHPGQRRVLAEAKRFNVLRCGRRFGKTTMGEVVLVEPALEGHPVAWFAPTNKIMLEPWQHVASALKPVTARLNKIEQRIELITGGVVDFWSLDNPDSGRGRKYKRIVVDEAGIVRNLQQAWQETIRPTLTDLKGDAWFLGTPKGRNFFNQLYERGQQGRPGWASWSLGTIDNPYIDPAEIAEAKASLPEPVFDQEYRGIPADDGGNPFGIKAIEACVCPMSVAPPVAYGVDLAKSHDWTVVCGLDADGVVCSLERWQGPWGETRKRILGLVNGWPTLIDSTGVGDPIVEDLQRVRPNIQGFKFSSQSKQQLMEGLASAVHTQEVGFPDGWLRGELETFEYEYTRTGVRYTAPEGLHDDGVCALALAVQAKRTMHTLDVRMIGAHGRPEVRNDATSDDPNVWTGM